MSLKKNIKRLKEFEFRRSHLINMVIAVTCILAGYLIAVISDASREAVKEINGIKSVIGEVSKAKSMEELKKKAKSNPELLKTIRSVIQEKK